MYYVYVIECATLNHYYVGYTRNLNIRIRTHKHGHGARFTQVHGFKKVISVKHHISEKSAKQSERELTEQYIQIYGLENVAGAGKSQVLKGNLRKSNSVSSFTNSALSSSFFKKKAYNITQIRQKYPRAYKKWNSVEDVELFINCQAGLSISRLAEKHERKRGAIHSRLKKLGLEQ